MLHAFLSILMIVTYQPAGALHIVIEPGNEVLIDGRSAGFTTEAASGMLLDRVAAGEHDIVIKTPSGAKTSVKVRIADGEMTTLNISSIGLRAGRARGSDSTIETDIVTDSRRCTLSWDGTSISGDADGLKVEHVAAGTHTVTIICGQRLASGEIKVPANAIVTIAPDFATGTLRVERERERSAMISVPTPTDDIMQLDIPLVWRRAIANALVSGIHIEGTHRNGDDELVATFTAPAWDVMEDFVLALRHQTDVRGADFLRSGPIPNGIRARVVITFRMPSTT